VAFALVLGQVEPITVSHVFTESHKVKLQRMIILNYELSVFKSLLAMHVPKVQDLVAPRVNIGYYTASKRKKHM